MPLGDSGEERAHNLSASRAALCSVVDGLSRGHVIDLDLIGHHGWLGVQHRTYSRRRLRDKLGGGGPDQTGVNEDAGLLRHAGHGRMAPRCTWVSSLFSLSLFESLNRLNRSA